MKLKALVTTLAIAALGVSVAAAAASPNHGKPRPGGDTPAKAPKKPANACRGPQVVLTGMYVSGSADSAGAGSFAMVVKKTNHRGRRLGLVAGSQVSVNVDAHTKYRRRGHASLADLLAKDLLNVKARACTPDQAPSGDGSGTGSGSDQPSDPAPKKGHGKRHDAVAAPASFTLLARKVDAHPPKPPKHGGDTGTTGTTTDQQDTGTTGTTTDQQDTGTTGTTTDGSGS